MVAGAAQSLYAEHPELGPVGIRTREGKVRWRPEWLGNPAVFCPVKGGAPPLQSITAGGGYLPYLSEPLSIERGIRYSGWRARDHRGSLYLTNAEIQRVRPLAAPGPYIVVEPCAPTKNINRRPPAAFWPALVDDLRLLLPHVRLVQLQHAEAELVPSLIAVPNDSFRSACAVVEQAVCYIGTEGGLAHAAQALHTPAVVLWGGCVDPYYLGYPEHINISNVSSIESPCGRLAPCAHCTQAWAGLDPAYVAAEVLAYTARYGVSRSG